MTTETSDQTINDREWCRRIDSKLNRIEGILRALLDDSSDSETTS